MLTRLWRIDVLVLTLLLSQLSVHAVENNSDARMHDAFFFFKNHQYKQAEDLYKSVCAEEVASKTAQAPALQQHTRRYGNALYQLALVYQGEGKLYSAESCLKEALSEQRQALFPEHPDVVRTLGALAKLYRQDKRYMEARLVLQIKLQIEQRLFGEKNPQPERTQDALKAVTMTGKLSAEGKSADSNQPTMDLLRQAAIKEQKVLNEKQISDRQEKALNEKRSAEKEAEDRYVNQIEIYSKRIEALRDVATSARSKGDTRRFNESKMALASVVEERLKFAAKQLEGDKRKLKDDLSFMTKSCQAISDPELRQITLEKVAQVAETELPSDDPALINARQTLANDYIEAGNYEEADKLLNKLIQTVRKPGAELEYLSIGLCNLGFKYDGLGKYADAERTYKSSLHIIERAGLSDNWVAANDLTYLGRLFVAQHRYKEAVAALKRTINARKKVIQMLRRVGASPGGIQEHQALMDKDIATLSQISGAPNQK